MTQLARRCLWRSNCPRGVQKRTSKKNSHTMQQIKSTLLRHRSGKMTQNILYSWFFIFAFITRTLAFFMFTLVLFFNRIYLSLHFDEYRWETYLRMINLAMRHLFHCTRNPKLETIGQSAKSWRKPRLLFTTRDIATKWTKNGSWWSFIESGGRKNNRNVVAVVVVVEGKQ